jgi:excinuclease ABC subunit A
MALRRARPPQRGSRLPSRNQGKRKTGSPPRTCPDGRRPYCHQASGKTLYNLDEPTTSLHFEDVRKLLEVLHSLVEQGNTVVVIEHNLEVIKTADWVIDLGPEGGDKGGEIVAEGTPEQVAKEARSYTGGYLEPLLAKPGGSNQPALAKLGKARASVSKRQREAAE